MIRPDERLGINHDRRLMHTLWLESRDRIRPDLVAVQDIAIPVPHPHTLDRAVKIALTPRLHRNWITTFLIEHMHGNLLYAGSPHAKPDSR